MNEETDFCGAFKMLLEGKSVSRVGWDEHTRIKLQNPDASSQMTCPYLYMISGSAIPSCKQKCCMAGRRKRPWTPSQEDLFADDWILNKTV